MQKGQTLFKMIKFCVKQGKYHISRNLIVIIFFVIFVALAIYCISNHFCQHLHFIQSNARVKDIRDIKQRTKQCFRLSWKNLTLHELAYGCAEIFPIKSWNYATETWMKDAMANQHGLCSRFVMLKEIQGRIGNQLFQVASLIGMAYKYDAIPIIQGNILLAKYFKLPNIVAQKHFREIKDVITCECNRSAVYYNCSKEFHSGKNVSLHGYLQSWKYFEETKHMLRDIFRSETVHVQKARQFLQSIARPGYQVVCIHIRRGDFTESRHERQGYITPNITYIKKARAYYSRKYVNVTFIAVSDDKAWCRENISNIILSPFNDSGNDMCLLMQCDHVIVTSGTFGWWGAWLSGGTTVYFNGYPVPGSSLSSRLNRQDYYPLDWIGLP